MKRWILWLLVLVLWAAPAQAVILFQDSFNAASCGNWGGNVVDANGNGCIKVNFGVIFIDTTVSFAGGASLGFLFDFPLHGSCESTNVNYNGTQCGGAITRSFSGIPDMWETFMIHLSSNMIINNPGTKVIFSGQSFYSQWTDFQSDNSSGHFDETSSFYLNPELQRPNGDPNLTVNIYGTFPPQRNQWACIEIHQKVNSAPGQLDAIYDLYVDGVLRVTDRFMDRAVGDNSLFTLTQMIRQNGAGKMNIDEYIQSTTRITCPNGSPQGDTTAPGVPQNVQVTFLELMGD